MAPVQQGNSADFWHAACGVQVDPARRSYCTGPVYPPREGWFVYDGRDERGIAFHGVPSYRVRESEALADFPAVVRALQAGQHRSGKRPFAGAVVEAGRRAWLAASPEQPDAHALLACIHDAWFEAWRERDREPVARSGASAVLALAPADGQPWNALVALAARESKSAYSYSAYQYHLGLEQGFDERWERSKGWHWNVIGEFLYLSGLVLFTAWPWLRSSSPWRWGLHVGLLPALFFLPYWFGYARLTFTSMGPTGGALYPWLIVHFRGLTVGGLDVWLLKRSPVFLANYSAAPGHVLSLSGMGSVGPVAVLMCGAALGLAACVLRRRFERLSGPT
jgi:hypothetical protein